MRGEGSARPLLVWAIPVAALVLVAAVIVLPRIASGPSRPSSPVTRTRPLDTRHRLDVTYTNEYLYDSTYETCDALGADQLARRLGVPTVPLTRIALAFAERNYAAAIRSGPYQGCLDALVDRRRQYPGR